MHTPPPARNRARDVLLFLRTLIRQRSGYVLRGVHGWALTIDVEARTKSHLPEILPSLARGGLLDREDVRVPGRPRPVWAYRLNNRGMERLCRETGCAPYEIDEPQPPRADLPPHSHVPHPCLRVLDELRRAADDPTTPTPFPGEPGWLTSRELDERIPSTFNDLDLAWLLERALIERRHHLPTPGARRPNVHYHVTQAGRVLRPLVWHEPLDLPRHA